MDISIKCDSLKAIYSVKKGMLRCVAPYEFTISQMPMIKVCIEEAGNRIITLTCEEEIEAKSEEEALEKLKSKYYNEDIVLDYSHHTNTEFCVLEKVKKKDRPSR